MMGNEQRLSETSSIPQSSINSNNQLHKDPCFSSHHPGHGDLVSSTLARRTLGDTGWGEASEAPAAWAGSRPQSRWGAPASAQRARCPPRQALAWEGRGRPTWEPLTSTLWMPVMVSIRLWASSMTTTWPCSRIPAACRAAACSSIW